MGTVQKTATSGAHREFCAVGLKSNSEGVTARAANFIICKQVEIGAFTLGTRIVLALTVVAAGFSGGFLFTGVATFVIDALLSHAGAISST